MNMMTNKFGLMAVASLVLLICATSVSAITEVKLIAPEKFFDSKITGFNRSTSDKIVKDQLVKLFDEVTAPVLKDQTLVIEVTDVDLAGYIDYFFGPQNQDMRLVNDNERYRLEFKYQLKSSDGAVEREGEANIKGFLKSYRPNKLKYSKYQLFGYMYEDIEKWVNETFAK